MAKKAGEKKEKKERKGPPRPRRAWLVRAKESVTKAARLFKRLGKVEEFADAQTLEPALAAILKAMEGLPEGFQPPRAAPGSTHFEVGDTVSVKEKHKNIYQLDGEGEIIEIREGGDGRGKRMYAIVKIGKTISGAIPCAHLTDGENPDDEDEE